ncbi:MAG: hypothetical protein R3247_10495 [Rhodothermales bacterium]|nr:hypothetical protein [Rhodothermales bacterium]
MPRRIPRLLPAILLLLAALPAAAQDAGPVTTGGPDVRLRLGGLIQSRASYGWMTAPREADRVGFGVRRARLRAEARVGPKAGLHLQVEAAGAFQALDAYAFYQPTERWRLRLGRMVSAQPRAFILTSATQIDAVDRAAIALLWDRTTLATAGRDFGLDLRYAAPQAEVLLFLHNGDGDWNRLRGNARGAILGDPTDGASGDLGDLAASAYAAFRPASVPGLEVGGFAGVSGRGNPNTRIDDDDRGYGSYAAHVYWGARPGSQPVRLKVDLIGVRFEETESIGAQQTLGVSFLGAFQVHPGAELFARAERYDPNTDADDDGATFVTAGASLSLSALRGRSYHQERLTLGYSTRRPENENAPRAHLLVLQAQIAL